MNTILQAAEGSAFFLGISRDDLEKMLVCLQSKRAQYKKGEVILMAGDVVDRVGLIISGGAKVIKEDANGRVALLTELSATDPFGEVFACAGVTRSPVTVMATEDTDVLLLNYQKVITTCTAACPFHTKLIENMLMLLARKNLELNQKNEILSQRTMREKILCYFNDLRGAAKRFTIPFNREELAHYLCVDRSALSNELCKMRDEGLIQFHKNTFEVL